MFKLRREGRRLLDGLKHQIPRLYCVEPTVCILLQTDLTLLTKWFVNQIIHRLTWTIGFSKLFESFNLI